MIERKAPPSEDRWCKIADDLTAGAQRARADGNMEAFVELLAGAAQALQVAKALKRMREASNR